MSPDQFIDHLQEALGTEYTVSRHPVHRQEPQFDVAPVPQDFDKYGQPYRKTFSVVQADMDDFGDTEIHAWAEVVFESFAWQRKRGVAPGSWGKVRAGV